MRIVSLLPSATEIVCALGLQQHLVGVSHGCNHPPGVDTLPRMTSTRVPYNADSDEIDAYVRNHLGDNSALYDLDMAALEAARPDVVVSQALCDVCAVATGDVRDAIRSLPGAPQLIDLTPNSLADVFDDIFRVGDATGSQARARSLVASLRARRDQVAERSERIVRADRPRVMFFEWLLPPFSGGHWNPELVTLAGGEDLLGSPGAPSRTLDWQTVSDASPDLAFVACCGFTIDRALADIAALGDNPAWLSLPAVQSQRLYVADGNAYFSSPGPRLLDGLELMAHALHPAVHPRPEKGSVWRPGDQLGQ
ncbi:cobalamin-binding protein [Chromatocurvus halotolerans]|uniref:Iron complex transport system substrate-binding protein n=1 Tax=Chromatocurvus halotolerans TaxID=1132028 RepID=A0A4R2KYI7_9GAMM|nr:cobalamin-binding protein [Chromatocurvus halotolerans]TCO78202.1 iron complex transport system substrate-binding protein [Chromatocurvus halotolerans]